MMDLSGFKNSLSSAQLPAHLSIYLQALWQDANGNWNQAHDLIQDVKGKQAAWIHAYLHRKEGDVWNADYWYSKAGRMRPAVSLEQEWEELAASFLKESVEE